MAELIPGFAPGGVSFRSSVQARKLILFAYAKSAAYSCLAAKEPHLSGWSAGPGPAASVQIQ